MRTTDFLKIIPDKPEFSGFRACIVADTLSSDTYTLLHNLFSLGQEHLFKNWDSEGTNDSSKQKFFENISIADNSYPGGLPAYVTNARKLLKESASGINPFEKLIPSQPDVVDLSKFGTIYDDMEKIALTHLHKTAIVLVAGGLGERLGYNGIKLDIPVEVIENVSYIAHYCSVISAMEMRCRKINPNHQVPLVIMTSQDTDAATKRTLAQNNYFGLKSDQVIILTQSLVPALQDNDGKIAKSGTYEIIMKPHGHGDIHLLMHTSGTAEKLLQKGIEHFLFIQDTNGQVFNAAFAAVGVSITHGFDFNSIGVKRIPGEAVGALTKLVGNGRETTLNVEYNQLEPLLRETVNPEGDVPDAEGFSVFPGNINALVIAVKPYVKILKESQGIIAEFVNPKYADSSRTVFSKPARLETMMQDLPKLFHSDEKTGVTVFDRVWCFSADKNNVRDAAKKFLSGGPPESAASAESDFYVSGRMKCTAAGIHAQTSVQELILGVPFIRGARIILRPSFALTRREVSDKIKDVFVGADATLILDGDLIRLESVRVENNAALIVRAVPGADVLVKNLSVSAPGFVLQLLTAKELQDPETPEYLKIRGYRFVRNEGVKEINITKPGRWVVEADEPCEFE